MEKPDERQNERDERERRAREASAPDSRQDKQSKSPHRHPDITAAGQSVVEVLASEKSVMDQKAFGQLSLSGKCSLANELSKRMAERTGNEPLRVDIGGDRDYLKTGLWQTHANMSHANSKSNTLFAESVARMHVFHYQETKFRNDDTYKQSDEGREVERVLSASGNQGDTRSFLLSTQQIHISGDARRAAEFGKTIKPPEKAKEQGEKQKGDAKEQLLPASMEQRRLDIVNTIFGDSRVTDPHKWEQLGKRSADKRKLANDLEERIAESQGRDPISIVFGNRDTAIFGEPGSRYGNIKWSETDSRKSFVTAVGQISLREYQEVSFEQPDKHTGMVTNATEVDRDGNEHDHGHVNIHEPEWSKRSRDLTGSNRIHVQTNLTTHLGRDIDRAYAQLLQIQEEKRDSQNREAEARRKSTRQRD